MKLIILALSGLLFIGANASPFSKGSTFILRAECARGPAYWCQNLQIAKKCRAVTHCIQTVWTKKDYPTDNDSVCKVCLDMVQQARDQLQSNETQADLKAVFEGTCEFIRIKKVRQECDKLADDFVPELVEMLSAQMNPQVVCSVAGLCNNAKVDKLIAEASNQMVEPKNSNGLTCNQCGKISTTISNKFAIANRDDVLEKMLWMCGQMSSFSDACSSIVLTYFNDWYAHLKNTLNSENICHMAGVCSDKYHKHEDEIEVILDSQIGFVQRDGDDIPCDLCKQLVTHLRDLLVANTTQAEFKTVLEGICKQTKSFKSECLSLADQYYDVIYDKLTNNLDPDGACFMIGICPKGLMHKPVQPVEFMPLVPSSQLLVKKKLLGDDEPVFSTQEIQSFQLPKDVLLLDVHQLEAHVTKKGNQFCTLCEYFLHFVQDALASPNNEESIKQAVLNTCHKLPKDIQGQCDNFVEMYGDAIIAMLIQDIDPAQVCPKLSVCTRTTSFANEKCPLCLFLVQDVEELLQNNKSKENIKNKLELLCNRLSDELRTECDDFVQTYTSELVDKLSSDFTPQQICLYLKLCTEKEEILIEHLGDKKSSSDILTNSIYQIETESDKKISSPECLLCEQLVKDVEKKIAKDKSKDHIKKVLEQACATLPKIKLKNKCMAAIEKNTDLIVNLIIKEVTPKEVCLALSFCLTIEQETAPPITVNSSDTPPCRLCQIFVDKLEEELNNKTAQEDIENCMKRVCLKLPKSLKANCDQFIDAYANEIIKHLPNGSPKDLCAKINVCLSSDGLDSIEVNDDGFFSPECILCEQLIKEVEKKVENNKTEEHIKEVLEQACSSFHKEKLKEKCIEIVEKNADYIVNAIVKQVSPKEICHELGLCDGSEGSENDDNLKEIATNFMDKYTEMPQCVLCELIMTKIEADLKNKRTQEEIEKSIKNICSKMPSKYSAKCTKFVENYADLVISLVSTVPPKELCGEINLCRANMKKDTTQLDVLECAICNTAADALATVLKKNGPKERTIVVETTCNLIPAKYYQKCYEFMEIYVESVTNLIERSEKMSNICVRVGKCYSDGDNSMFTEISKGMLKSKAKSSGSSESDETIKSGEFIKPLPRVYGDGRCTFGPSYWCTSPETIEECKAHAFCAGHESP